MTVLRAVVTFNTAPVAGLVAVLAVMALCIAVATTVNARFRAIRGVVAGLQTVEACTPATATTGLERLGTVYLTVAE